MKHLNRFFFPMCLFASDTAGLFVRALSVAFLRPGLLYLAHGGIQAEPGTLTCELVEFLQERKMRDCPLHAVG